MMFRDARKGLFEWRNTIAPLLGDWVVLLAMKHRRAPLPVSSALWKGLLRKGFQTAWMNLQFLRVAICSWETRSCC
jgi:hypothetical protein